MKTIILTGGGTAGHVVPNIALLPELEKKFDKIMYIGTNGIEKTIAQSKGLPFYEITASKLVRKNIFKNFTLPINFIKSVNKSKKLLKEIKPDIVFSKGGFVALPVVIAAKKLNIPVISHESDLSFGLANKIILKYADKVVTSFEKTALKNKKCVYLGSPIRQEIFNGSQAKALKETEFIKNKKTVMFFGGSLGAKAINNIVFKCLPQLVKTYNVIHITGKGNKINFKHKNYYQTEYTDKIENFFALADIVVCRGGANSLFELLAISKPMIIIPLSLKASRGDQIENAKYFKEKGWAKVIMGENLTPSALLSTLDKTDVKVLQTNMQNSSLKNSNSEIVKLLEETLKQNTSKPKNKFCKRKAK